MDDRRRLNPRLEIELPAEYSVEAADELQPGRIANLSAGGAAVSTAKQLPVRSLLQRFRFSLPEGASSHPLEAVAVVIHARPYLNHQGTIEYLSGLHFLGLESSAFERLERFLLERLDASEP